MRSTLVPLLGNLAIADDGARTLPIASGDCVSVLELAGDIAEEERGYTVDVEMVENPRETVSEDFVVGTDKARDAIGFEAEYRVEDAVREMME